MLLQIGSRPELLAADIAQVGFVSRVNSLVPDQVAYLYESPWFRNLSTYLAEGLAAVFVVADVWSLLVVDSLVLLQR